MYVNVTEIDTHKGPNEFEAQFALSMGGTTELHTTHTVTETASVEGNGMLCFPTLYSLNSLLLVAAVANMEDETIVFSLKIYLPSGWYIISAALSGICFSLLPT